MFAETLYHSGSSNQLCRCIHIVGDTAIVGASIDINIPQGENVVIGNHINRRSEKVHIPDFLVLNHQNLILTSAKRKLFCIFAQSILIGGRIYEEDINADRLRQILSIPIKIAYLRLS